MRKISRPVVKAQSGRRRQVENVSGRRRPVEKRQDGLWLTVDAVNVRLTFSSRPMFEKNYLLFILPYASSHDSMSLINYNVLNCHNLVFLKGDLT